MAGHWFDTQRELTCKVGDLVKLNNQMLNKMDRTAAELEADDISILEDSVMEPKDEDQDISNEQNAQANKKAP